MKRDLDRSFGPQDEGPDIDVEELVEFLAQQVVDDPAQVQVYRQGQTLLIRVGEGEEGRLIGRQGRVIQAIRTLARSATSPRARLTVDLDGPRAGQGSGRSSFSSRERRS
ncbi:KH domain-containing protein [Deinococcus sp. Marseille-Q6407]|uniref:KH domain-containing protein n=1 Tax=Deinococcus sp. Marseille-Q6407 TaxID=2969223 RepID=UPI0021C158AA|nr:KH domain-containing protein [Deinococcus sp. Marseille-Q6407]